MDGYHYISGDFYFLLLKHFAMKGILLSCLILFSLTVICQETKVELVDFYCKKDENVPVSRAKNRIIKQDHYGGDHTIVIEVISSCAGAHNAKAELVDNKLKLSFMEKDEVLYETNEKGEKSVLFYKDKNQCQLVITYRIKGLAGNKTYDIELIREKLQLSDEGYKYTSEEKVYLEKNP